LAIAGNQQHAHPLNLAADAVQPQVVRWGTNIKDMSVVDVTTKTRISLNFRKSAIQYITKF
jgi:hypothetical protein